MCVNSPNSRAQFFFLEFHGDGISTGKFPPPKEVFTEFQFRRKFHKFKIMVLLEKNFLVGVFARFGVKLPLNFVLCDLSSFWDKVACLGAEPLTLHRTLCELGRFLEECSYRAVLLDSLRVLITAIIGFVDACKVTERLCKRDNCALLDYVKELEDACSPSEQLKIVSHLGFSRKVPLTRRTINRLYELDVDSSFVAALNGNQSAMAVLWVAVECWQLCRVQSIFRKYVVAWGVARGRLWVNVPCELEIVKHKLLIGGNSVKCFNSISAPRSVKNEAGCRNPCGLPPLPRSVVYNPTSVNFLQRRIENQTALDSYLFRTVRAPALPSEGLVIDADWCLNAYDKRGTLCVSWSDLSQPQLGELLYSRLLLQLQRDNSQTNVYQALYLGDNYRFTRAAQTTLQSDGFFDLTALQMALNIPIYVPYSGCSC